MGRLVVFSDHGTKGKAGRLAVAPIHLLLLIMARTAAVIDVRKLHPGQKPKNYSNKATPTLTVTAMRKLVKG